jgi:bis(5'-nucleosyl)-tetraphosphatase (symmetrical)
MATYAVGDIQGCLSELKELLNIINFSQNDTLWCVGDLINRGPESLETLRFLQSLGDQCIAVLGNHDLHLLACRYGARKPTKKDTFDEILTADDLDELVEWLRFRPLLHVDTELGFCMAHAGIPPVWDIDQAQAYSREVETVLQSDNPRPFFANMYGNQPDCWSPYLRGFERLRVITNYFTRMRFCTADGKLEFDSKESPDSAPPGFQPWYSHTNHPCKDQRVLFGHWAALMGATHSEAFIGLDTGCVWGGYLTALCLDDGEMYCSDCSLN